MSFEQQLEDLLVRAFKRAIVEGLQSLPFTLPADPGTAAPAEKRSRKKADTPKEEAPQPSVAVETAPVVAEVSAPAPIQTPVVAQAQAEAANSVGDAGSESLPEIERRHVSAALITVAQAPEHGPAKAYGILTGLGVKDVNGLKPAQYVEVVAKAAEILGIKVADALRLEPKKV